MTRDKEHPTDNTPSRGAPPRDRAGRARDSKHTHRGRSCTPRPTNTDTPGARPKPGRTQTCNRASARDPRAPTDATEQSAQSVRAPIRLQQSCTQHTHSRTAARQAKYRGRDGGNPENCAPRWGGGRPDAGGARPTPCSTLPEPPAPCDPPVVHSTHPRALPWRGPLRHPQPTRRALHEDPAQPPAPRL